MNISQKSTIPSATRKVNGASQSYLNEINPLLNELSNAFAEVDTKAIMQTLASIAYVSKIEMRDSINRGHDIDVIDQQLDRIFTVIDTMVFLDIVERSLNEYDKLQSQNNHC